MQPGKLMVADTDGVFILKLSGDVRLTCTTALDAYCEKLFNSKQFSGLAIDLSNAQNIDSTTLGMLAKMAIAVRDRFGMTPTIISTNPDITRILDSMGFEAVFDIRETRPEGEAELAELPAVCCSESDMRDRVIDAHRVLMGMNPRNRAEFRDLVQSLEAGRG